MPGVVLDIEQHLLLMEIEPPFDKRDMQLARRRMAKRWHPDIAPAGKQFEHERHLKAINEAADQLERLAEGSRGGKVSRNAMKVNAAAARAARAEAGRRAYEEEQRARESQVDKARNDPFGDRTPDHSVVHRYARCLSYPEWGVGSVTGIYFTGEDDQVQQWARVKFQLGVRTVPAGARVHDHHSRSAHVAAVAPVRAVGLTLGTLGEVAQDVAAVTGRLDLLEQLVVA